MSCVRKRGKLPIPFFRVLDTDFHISCRAIIGWADKKLFFQSCTVFQFEAHSDIDFISRPLTVIICNSVLEENFGRTLIIIVDSICVANIGVTINAISRASCCVYRKLANGRIFQQFLGGKPCIVIFQIGQTLSIFFTVNRIRNRLDVAVFTDNTKQEVFSSVAVSFVISCIKARIDRHIVSNDNGGSSNFISRSIGSIRSHYKTKAGSGGSGGKQDPSQNEAQTGCNSSPLNPLRLFSCFSCRGRFNNVLFIHLADSIQNAFFFHKLIPSFSNNCRSSFRERSKDIFTLLSLIE